jgi:hypothetical protein
MDDVSVLQTDLFPEFEAGLGHDERGAGCAKPIGRGSGSRRRVHRTRQLQIRAAGGAA